MNLKNMLGQIEANSRDRRQIGDRLSHMDGAPLKGKSRTTLTQQVVGQLGASRDSSSVSPTEGP
jgi:hypothetical protein